MTNNQDLVCGLMVDEAHARYFSEYDSKTYFFCSAECKRAFDDHPDKYIHEHAKQELGL